VKGGRTSSFGRYVRKSRELETEVFLVMDQGDGRVLTRLTRLTRRGERTLAGGQSVRFGAVPLEMQSRRTTASLL
jgi:hypothetical protein